MTSSGSSRESPLWKGPLVPGCSTTESGHFLQGGLLGLIFLSGQPMWWKTEVRLPLRNSSARGLKSCFPGIEEGARGTPERGQRTSSFPAGPPEEGETSRGVKMKHSLG